MKQVFTTITALCLFIQAGICNAYEPNTHQKLADVSAHASVLDTIAAGSNTTILGDLGLPSYTDQNTKLWFPVSQRGLIIDLGPDGSKYITPVTGNVQALIQAGAAIEDDEYRPFCHFYDPTSGQPLQVLGQTASHSDPDWALGEDSSGEPISSTCSIIVHIPVLGQDIQLGQQTQQYSLLDAENYYYAALISPNQSDRASDFGDMFLSLGHVLHLLQDMAQPQHVRNDMHCDSYKCIPIGEYHPSRYERDVFGIHYDTSVLGQYTPDYSTERGFWTGGNSGLADFTNQNFLSVGTLDWVDGNSVGYSSPALGAVDAEEEVSAVYQNDLHTQMPHEIATVCGPPKSCKLEFRSTSGTDGKTGGSVFNAEAASESVFNEYLTDFGSHKVYTLNIVTETSAWNLLQPMAVGYGAGMIDHFFRGRLGMHPDSSQPNGYIVTNLSTVPMSNGTLTVYYDAADGTRYPVPNATWPNVSVGKAGNDPADQFKIQITPPVDPAPANPGQYMLVFKGIISEDQQNGEQGIAALQYTPNQDVYVGISTSGFQTTLNSVKEYMPDGTNVKSAALLQGVPNEPAFLAVYDKTVYTSAEVGITDSNVDEYSYPNYTINNSDIIASSGFRGLINGDDYYQQFGFGIGVNDNNLFSGSFLADETSGAVTYSVSVFDHAGKFIRNIPESYQVESLSVNDNHLCVILKESSLVVQLQDMNGGATASLMTLPLDGSIWNLGCASSRDRHYVLTETIDSSDNPHNTVYVFDENGTPITSFPIVGPSTGGTTWQIAANEGNVYVSYFNYGSTQLYGGVAVINRLVTHNPDGTTSETYQQMADIGHGVGVVSVAVDAAY